MSLSSIDYYKRAAQGAVLAIAIGPALPTGILSVVGGVALAALGFGAIEFVSNVAKNKEELIAALEAKRALLEKTQTEFTELSDSNTKESDYINFFKKTLEETTDEELKEECRNSLFELQHITLYKAAPTIAIFEVEETILNKILEKIKTFSAYKQVTSEVQSRSEEELKTWWKQELSKGICHGQSSALLDIELKEDETFSLQDRVAFMDPNEATFRQCVYKLKKMYAPELINLTLEVKQNKYKIKLIEDEMKKLDYESNKLNHKGALNEERPGEIQLNPSHNCSSAEYRELKLKKYKEEEIKLNAWDPLPATKSEKNEFLAASPRKGYQIHLEKAIESSSIKNGEIRGTINVPNHQMTFQYGPKEYFIYDSSSERNGGLFKYPDKESFFRGMHVLVQQLMRSEYEEETQREKALMSFQIYEGKVNRFTL